MGLFGEKKKMFKTLEEAGDAYSGAIFKSAVFATNIYINTKEDISFDNNTYWKIILRFSYFMYHMTDRTVFGKLGVGKRDEFINGLTPALAIILTNAEKQAVEKGVRFKQDAEMEGLRRIWPVNDEKKNKRCEAIFRQVSVESLRLSHYKEIVSDEIEDAEGTLLWEFSKSLSEEIFNSKSNVLEIVALCGAATAAGKFLEILYPILEGH